MCGLHRHKNKKHKKQTSLQGRLLLRCQKAYVLRSQTPIIKGWEALHQTDGILVFETRFARASKKLVKSAVS